MPNEWERTCFIQQEIKKLNHWISQHFLIEVENGYILKKGLMLKVLEMF